jgi:hypothetical protein
MIDPRTPSPRARRSGARHRRQEGAALLVIMLIILITTAAAAVSVQNTTTEMRAAGQERLLTQARYSAEAAMQATLAWLDLVGNDGSFLGLWQTWQATPPPEMRMYSGGHQILNTLQGRHMAARTLQATQAMLPQVISPVSGPNTTLPIPDFTGSFGPSQPYSMDPYVVDITDCFEAPKTMLVGGAVNIGPGALVPTQFYCTLTVRGRISMTDALGNPVGAAVTWDLPGGLNGQVQDRSGAAHDTRATILTPSMLLPSSN